eukprot:765503-Hanusia_phi.AAC.9
MNRISPVQEELWIQKSPRLATRFHHTLQGPGMAEEWEADKVCTRESRGACQTEGAATRIVYVQYGRLVADHVEVVCILPVRHISGPQGCWRPEESTGLLASSPSPAGPVSDYNGAMRKKTWISALSMTS